MVLTTPKILESRSDIRSQWWLK